MVSNAGTFLADTLGAGNPTVFDGDLYFSSGILPTAIGGPFESSGLWRTDGTATGTVKLAGFAASSGGINELVAGNGQLYFAGYGEIGGTDGTASGTWGVAVLEENDGSYPGFYSANHLTVFNNHLLFEVASSPTAFNPPLPGDGPPEDQIWIADDANYAVALPFNGFSPNTDGSDPTDFTDVDGTEFFIAGNEPEARTQLTELWKTDGTSAGTVMLKDFHSGPYEGYDYGSFNDLSDLTNVNGTLYFAANDGIDGWGLWKSDGTASGTVLVRAFSYLNAYGDDLLARPYYLTNVNGNLFFTADDGVHGWQLWESDGTTGGTKIVDNISPAGDAGFYDLTDVNGRLFFVANDGTDGWQLWASDGTSTGTIMLSDVNASGGGLYAAGHYNLTAVNAKVFFTASDGIHGTQLWKSDGTIAGTMAVSSGNQSDGGLSPGDLTAAGNTLFFSASDGIDGTQLWTSDGTPSGTVMVSSGNANNGGLGPANLTAVGNTLFFTANNGSDGTQLWESDGTTVGTKMVSCVNVGVGFSDSGPAKYDIGNLTNVNGTLYFTGNDGIHGTELWENDGTSTGTFMVADIIPGTAGSYPSSLAKVGGSLIFAANDGTHGAEPWKLVANPIPATSTSLASSSPISVSKQSLTLTAKVAGPTPLEDSPTGTMSFTDQDPISGNITTLGMVTLDGDGTAILANVVLSTTGSHLITADYSGDGFFSPSSIGLSETVNDLNATNLQSVVDMSLIKSSTAPIALHAATSADLSSSLTAIGGVTNTSGSPVTVTLDVGGGSTTPNSAFDAPSGVQVELSSSSANATVEGATVNTGIVVIDASVTPSNWTVNGGSVIVKGSETAGDFIVNGGTVTLANGTVITGNSPAITIYGGTVILDGVIAQTATNSPTIVVNGGNLIVRDSTIQESTSYTQAAILINGGTVDLGTAASAGGNIFNVNGTGEFVEDRTTSPVPDFGNTLEVDGARLSAPFLSFSILESSASPALLGQPLIFTASVRAANPSDGTPTGTLDFIDTSTGTDLGTATSRTARPFWPLRHWPSATTRSLPTTKATAFSPSASMT